MNYTFPDGLVPDTVMGSIWTYWIQLASVTEAEIVIVCVATRKGHFKDELLSKTTN